MRQRNNVYSINPLTVKGNLETAIQEVRRSLLIIYDDRCQMCHKKNKRLHIHHRNSCALDWRIENLLLLCPWCHKNIQDKRFTKTLSTKPEVKASFWLAERMKKSAPYLDVEVVARNLREYESKEIRKSDKSP